MESYSAKQGEFYKHLKGTEKMTKDAVKVSGSYKCIPRTPMSEPVCNK